MISKTVILIRIALANIFSSVLNLLVGLVLVLGAATARPTSAVTMLAITRRRTERHCIIGA